MGVDLIVKGADFSANALGYDPPVTRGLRYWGFFGSAAADPSAKAARLRKNWTPGGTDGGVVGSPVIGAASTRFKSASSYVDTGLTESSAMTAFAVIRSDATLADTASRPYFLGGPNFGLYVSASTGAPQATLSMSATYDNAGSPALQVVNTPVAAMTSWVFVALAREPGVGFRMILPGSAVTSPRADTRSVFASSASKVRFGSGGRSDFQGESEIAMAGEFNVVLTEAEIASIYGAAKAYCAGRGIAI